jgi:ubiquinone/menaquinone biosynthesis C-methylase UbiE
MKSNQDTVRLYWEGFPCGTTSDVTGDREKYTLEWFRSVENFRYKIEPEIHAVAQFTRFRGARLLEVGVGTGTDHLQWARAGAICHGVDLAQEAIDRTSLHLAHYGLTSELYRLDAETLPFEDNSFDVVYSWGVIHHSTDPNAIVAEIHRVLRPGGMFIGMMYRRHSLVVLKLWLRHALLKGKPFRSFAHLVWHHMESLGTRSYTRKELLQIFSIFSDVSLKRIVTYHDRAKLPPWTWDWIPDCFGWFIAIRAIK